VRATVVETLACMGEVDITRQAVHAPFEDEHLVDRHHEQQRAAMKPVPRLAVARSRPAIASRLVQSELILNGARPDRCPAPVSQPRWWSAAALCSASRCACSFASTRRSVGTRSDGLGGQLNSRLDGGDELPIASGATRSSASSSRARRTSSGARGFGWSSRREARCRCCRARRDSRTARGTPGFALPRPRRHV
jgi:hypothetical protein